MPAVGLEHGAFAVVGHGLRDAVVRLDVVDCAVGIGHRLIEDVQVLKLLAAGVVVPDPDCREATAPRREESA